MNGSIKSVPVFVAALLLSACGLRIPDPGIYAIGCPQGEVPAASEGQAQFFFLSSALPDCRTGSLALAPFRHLELTYGSGLYQWTGPETLPPPVLIKHDYAGWTGALEQRIADPRAGGRVLVFIHGFNNSFDDAYEMAAKLADLNGADVPLVMLHWPSRARSLSYAVDESTIAWAQDPLDQALADLSARSDDITVVAHSLGVRAAIRAVLALDRIPGARPQNIRRIVLASGDEDRDRVLRNGGSVDLMLRHPRAIVIYSSYRDVPLDLSRRLHAYARLGSTDCKYDLRFDMRVRGKLGNCHLTRPRPGLAVVSTSRIDPQDIYDHTDFVDDCRTRADLSAFLRGEAPPVFRRDISESEDRTGFEIDPDIPDQNGLCADPEN